MKSRDVPTSPKHRPQSEEIDTLYKMEPTIVKPNNPRGPYLVVVMLCSMVLTLGAVIGLRIAADRYPSVMVLKYFRPSTSTTERVVVQQTTPSQDAALSDAITAITPSLGAVVKGGGATVRQLSDRIGNAIVVSNDGSALTMTSAATLGVTSLVRLNDGLEQLAHEPQTDPATNVVFVHLNVSTTPVTFADSDQSEVGDRIIVVRYNPYAGGVEYMPTSIMGLHERSSVVAGNDSLVESSELLDRQLRLADTFDTSWIGAGAYDMKGHLVGILSNNDTSRGTYVVPINSLKHLVTKFVANEQVQRALLGVRYVNLSYNSTIDPYPSKGAFLFSNDKKVPAITLKSPASTSGLQANDVITAVDGTPLNELRSLSDAVASYAPNSKVTLTVIRSAKEMKIAVTLGIQPAKK